MGKVNEPPNSESEMTKKPWNDPYCQPGNSNGADDRRCGQKEEKRQATNLNSLVWGDTPERMGK
eukprot:14665128-Heterocapsa_arctica.AAC.1